MGQQPEIKFLLDMPTGPLNRVADNSLAKRLMGWEPQVPFREGVQRTVDWYWRTKDRDQVRQIPNVRKVSMSPWVDQARGAAEIGSDFVFSRKPNPAFVATDRFMPDQVRADLVETRDICAAHGCPLEFILKDISTVRYEPERLFEWGRIAMQVAKG